MGPGWLASFPEAGSPHRRRQSTKPEGLARYLAHVPKAKYEGPDIPQFTLDVGDDGRNVDRARLLDLLHQSNSKLRSAWKWVSGKSLTICLSCLSSLIHFRNQE